MTYSLPRGQGGGAGTTQVVLQDASEAKRRWGQKHPKKQGYPDEPKTRAYVLRPVRGSIVPERERRAARRTSIAAPGARGEVTPDGSRCPADG